MARRTIKDFSAGLKRQIEQENTALEALARSRDEAMQSFDERIREQKVKIEALDGVYKDLTEGEGDE